MVGRVFGLDFGTTNSLVSVIQGDTALPLVDRTDNRPHPSVVWYRGGEVVVGRSARAHLDSTDGAAPQGLLRSPKMSLRRDGPIHLDGRDIAPSDAIAEVLSFLRADARKPRAGGEPYEVERAVMTIPVDFEGPQRRELRAAARKAGIGVVQFVHEPVAALYAYLRGRPHFRREVAELEGRVLLVFDWGGGTLDLTLCRVLGGQLFQIKSIGDNEIGGDIFDERLRNRARFLHAEAHGLADVTAIEAPGMGAKLLAQCEQAKIALCTEERASYRPFVRDYARAEGAARNLVVEITRSDLERGSESLVRRGLGLIDRILDEARLDHADVHLCLPTGGMVNMPAIRKGLVERFGGRVPRLPNGDRIISEGAAWIAHDNLRLTLAKPIEVRVADGSGSGHCRVLVPKGLELPVENQVVAAANCQFVCADPRDGFAAFEFVKPKAVGLVGPDAERETLCVVNVPVNPRTNPLIERLHCKVSIDHDYVAHVHVASLGRGAEATTEFHRLDFGLAIPAGAGRSADGKGRGETSANSVPAGSARVTGPRRSVAMRPNVLPAEGFDARHAVAGDLAFKLWPGMFSPDRPEATPRQREEYLYYTPCSLCGRSLFQIEEEGLLPTCRPSICSPKPRRPRAATQRAEWP